MSRNPKVSLPAAVGYPAIGRIEGTYDIDADQVTDTLAVNHDLKIDEEGDVDYRASWNVSHIPTGVAILRGLSSAQAAKAAAHLLEAMDYGAVTTTDRRAANDQFLALNVTAVKAWLADQIGRSRTSKSLTDKIKKQTRAVERGEPIPAAEPEAEAKPSRAPRRKAPKAAKKKAAKKKAAKKPAVRKIAKKKKKEIDLLMLARKARRGNPDELVADVLLAGGTVPYTPEQRPAVEWLVERGWAGSLERDVWLTGEGLHQLSALYPEHARQGVSNPAKERLLDW